MDLFDLPLWYYAAALYIFIGVVYSAYTYADVKATYGIEVQVSVLIALALSWPYQIAIVLYHVWKDRE